MTDMTSIKALIITGGDVDYEFRMTKAYNLIIAVDGGLEAADKMNIYPDVIIGDFDTIHPEILHKYSTDSDIEVIRLNSDKDDTDTQAAVNYAISQKVNEIDMLGGTGSRLDHTLGNLFLLKMAYEQGIQLNLYTSLSKIYLIHGKKQYKANDFYGVYISFLQFDGSAKGVTLEGFKYEVKDFDFDTKESYRLGISNEPDGRDAMVTIKEGWMICVESIQDKKVR